jgi:signal transduction histidine kinase
VPLLHRVRGTELPSFGLAALLRTEAPGPWQHEAGGLRVGAHRWPVDAQSRVLLRLPLGRPAAEPLAWQRLMQAALGQTDDAELAGLVRGRPVFIGSSAFFADAVMTPQGRLSGTELNAAVAAALAADAVLQAEGPREWAASLALLAVALVPGLMLVLARRGPDRAPPVAWPLLASGAAALGALALGLAAVTVGGVLPRLAPALYVLALLPPLCAWEQLRWQRRRELQAEHERALAEARSRAKTDLLAQVSHEMRTPMNAVLGMTDILARSPLKPDQAHYVEVLGAAGRQAFALINDLLDNARIESGRLELNLAPFDLVDLVDLQLELLRPRAQAKQLWLRAFAQSGVPGLVRGDAQRVAQIVANLVSNAI